MNNEKYLSYIRLEELFVDYNDFRKQYNLFFGSEQNLNSYDFNKILLIYGKIQTKYKRLPQARFAFCDYWKNIIVDKTKRLNDLYNQKLNDLLSEVKNFTGKSDTTNSLNETSKSYATDYGFEQATTNDDVNTILNSLLVDNNESTIDNNSSSTEEIKKNFLTHYNELRQWYNDNNPIIETTNIFLSMMAKPYQKEGDY